MKLNDPESQSAETEARRLEETATLNQLAFRTADPLLLMQVCLDARARQAGYHIEYDSDYEDEI